MIFLLNRAFMKIRKKGYDFFWKLFKKVKVCHGKVKICDYWAKANHWSESVWRNYWAKHNTMEQTSSLNFQNYDFGLKCSAYPGLRSALPGQKFWGHIWKRTFVISLTMKLMHCRAGLGWKETTIGQGSK